MSKEDLVVGQARGIPGKPEGGIMLPKIGARMIEKAVYDSLLSAAREAVKALNCDTCHSCSKHFAALARLREYTE